MLGLFIVQIIANLRSHPKNSRQETGVRGQEIRRDWGRLMEIRRDTAEIRRRYGRDAAETSG
jgi:hypothetical protein